MKIEHESAFGPGGLVLPKSEAHRREMVLASELNQAMFRWGGRVQKHKNGGNFGRVWRLHWNDRALPDARRWSGSSTSKEAAHWWTLKEARQVGFRLVRIAASWEGWV